MLLKNFSKDLTCVSPIPSMLIISLILLFFAKLKKFSTFFVKSAIILAFSIPMCLIPKEKINLSSVTSLEFSIENFRFETDCDPHPSSEDIFW